MITTRAIPGCAAAGRPIQSELSTRLLTRRNVAKISTQDALAADAGTCSVRGFIAT